MKYGGEIRRLLPVTADTDGDGMSTELELRYGLDPNSGTGANGAGGDPDNDGVNNADEIAAGTHPRGFDAFTRQLAEGASSAFFETSVSLMNNSSQPASVVLRFLKDTATTVTWPVTIAPRRRLTINPGQLASVSNSSFATIVESDHEVVVERTMKWDRSNYGAHTEKAILGPASNWFFAEGSQGFFLTYVLLTNPSTSQNRASIRFLRESGGPIVQEFTLAPLSRRTIDCGAIAALVNTSFGIEVTFLDAPGAAERAMYFGLPPDRLFKAGHESAGVTTPSTEWFLAEGATGLFFETFVLIANPNSGVADVTLTYVTETGAIVTRNKTVPANARITVNIEAEGSPALDNAAVATRVVSNIPVVVERAQYWPFAPPLWFEAHNAFGVTAAGTRWGFAEGQIGRSESANSFILLANNTNTAATVTVDFIREVEVPVTKTFTVPANTRLSVAVGPGTVVPELRHERFGAVVEQHGADRRRTGALLGRELGVLERRHGRHRHGAAAVRPRTTPESFPQRMFGVGGGSEDEPGVPSAGVGAGVPEPSTGTSAMGWPSDPSSQVFCRGGRNGRVGVVERAGRRRAAVAALAVGGASRRVDDARQAGTGRAFVEMEQQRRLGVGRERRDRAVERRRVADARGEAQLVERAREAVAGAVVVLGRADDQERVIRHAGRASVAVADVAGRPDALRALRAVDVDAHHAVGDAPRQRDVMPAPVGDVDQPADGLLPSAAADAEGDASARERHAGTRRSRRCRTRRDRGSRRRRSSRRCRPGRTSRDWRPAPSSARTPP